MILVLSIVKLMCEFLLSVLPIYYYHLKTMLNLFEDIFVLLFLNLSTKWQQNEFIQNIVYIV